MNDELKLKATFYNSYTGFYVIFIKKNTTKKSRLLSKPAFLQFITNNGTK